MARDYGQYGGQNMVPRKEKAAYSTILFPLKHQLNGKGAEPIKQVVFLLWFLHLYHEHDQLPT